MSDGGGVMVVVGVAMTDVDEASPAAAVLSKTESVSPKGGAPITTASTAIVVSMARVGVFDPREK